MEFSCQFQLHEGHLKSRMKEEMVKRFSKKYLNVLTMLHLLCLTTELHFVKCVEIPAFRKAGNLIGEESSIFTL